jgi:hypothetical protein
VFFVVAVFVIFACPVRKDAGNFYTTLFDMTYFKHI